MNWKSMCEIEPGLQRLADNAYHAGQHRASWHDTLAALYESLSKCCGRGASREELLPAACYELARAKLFTSWSRGTKADVPPVDVQPTLFNCTEQYT